MLYFLGGKHETMNGIMLAESMVKMDNIKNEQNNDTCLWELQFDRI